MSKRKKHQHKKTYYNDIALRLAEKLFGLRHLHYGYFDNNLTANLENFKLAQDAYMEHLLSYVPDEVSDVFDVGCGTGGMAKQLLAKGKKLTCLAPDPYLIERTLENTGNKVETITDLYENVEHLANESFDLILMSESCQYIDIKKGWKQNAKLLRKPGYVLVSDFFKKKPINEPDISKSGHLLDKYLEMAKEHGFSLVKKVDITEKVAPTMDIYQSMIYDKVFPVFEAIFEFVARRYPRVYRSLKFVLQKHVDKLKRKYSKQSAEIFQTYKGYYVLLFERR